MCVQIETLNPSDDIKWFKHKLDTIGKSEVITSYESIRT
jgi:hypothetical protein